MADPTTNAQRAGDFIANHSDCEECADGGYMCRAHVDQSEALERMLHQAEDRGARQPMPVDADTVEALTRMVREMLEGLADPGTGLRRLLDAKAIDIAQLVIANFHIRLMDEEDEPEDGK